MPADVGGQNISLKYQSSGNSMEINERFVGIRPVGIYSGGLLSVVDGTHASVAPLVCEIGDGTHQVRNETTTAVSVVVGLATSYLVCRWSYTGTTLDYMEILAVGSGDVQANDVHLGRCSFAGAVLNGFDYGDTTYRRTSPNVQSLWLKVIPKGSGSLKAQVLPGYYQSHTASVFVPLQETDALVPPTASNKIYLVYLNTTTGAVALDSTGVEGATPAAPSYAGRLVLAEITLASTDTEITSAKIKNVQSFVTPGRQSTDGTTISSGSDGTLQLVDQEYIICRPYGAQIVGQSSWTALTNTGSVIQRAGLVAPTSGVFTLSADKMYDITYNLLFQRVTGSPVFQARFHVLSGDLSWWYAADDYNQSNMKGEIPSSLSGPCQLSGTWFIKPASITTLQVEALTKDSDLYTSHVLSGLISIKSR